MKMPQKKFTEKFVANPSKNKNVGRRTGKDMKAGKSIRKIAGGFENFDDYWSESEADMTREATFVKPNQAAEVSAMNKGDPADVPLQQSSQVSQEKHPDSVSSVLIQSQIGNVEPNEKIANPVTGKHIGRRTGKDVKAGKNIRILDGGFENFDDYWSESDADSVASFSTASSGVIRASKRSSGPAKRESSTVITQEESSGTQKRRSYNRKAASKKEDTENSRQDQVKATVTNVPDEVPCKNTQASDSQAEEYTSEDADSQKSRTSSGDVDSQEDRETCEEYNNQKNDSVHKGQVSQEDLCETRNQQEQEDRLGTKQGRPDSLQNNETENESDKASDETNNHETENESNKASDETSNHTTQSQTGNAISSQLSTASSKTSWRASVQQSSVLAVEGSSGSAKKQSNRYYQLSKESASKETESMNRDAVQSEVEQSEDRSRHKKSSSGELEKGQDNTDRHGRKRIDKTERESVQEKMSSGSAAKNLPESSTDTGDCKQKEKQTGKDSCSSSQSSSVTDPQPMSSQHDSVTLPQSNADGTNTESSQSQMSATASPKATSQKSSVYLSIAGDVTGSITRLSNNSTVSPEPKLFGARRRSVAVSTLSYAESPNKAEQSKESAGTIVSRLPRAVPKISLLKSVSSPIPEDHRESSEDAAEDRISPTRSGPVDSPSDKPSSAHTKRNSTKDVPENLTTDTIKKNLSADTTVKSQTADTAKISTTAKNLTTDAAKKNLTIGTSENLMRDSVKKNLTTDTAKKNLTADTAKRHQQNAQLESELSQDSPSEMGMFVSLASQAQDRANTTHASVSDSEDDQFQIIDESRVHRAPAGQKSSGAVTGKGRHNIRKITRKKPEPSVDSDDRVSVEDDRTQHEQSSKPVSRRHVIKSKCLNEADGQPSSDSAHSQVKKEKVKKKNNDNKNEPVTVVVEDRDVSFVDKETEQQKFKKLSTRKRRKSPGQDDQELLTDAQQEGSVVGEKCSKVSVKISVDDSNISSKRSRQNSPPVKRKKKILKKHETVHDDDENLSLEVKPQHEENTVKSNPGKKNKSKAKKVNENGDNLLVKVKDADVGCKPRRKKRSKEHKTSEDDENVVVELEVEIQHEEVAVESKHVKKSRSKVQKLSEDDENPQVEVELQNEEAAVGSQHGRKRSKIGKASERNPEELESLEQTCTVNSEVSTLRRGGRKTRKMRVQADQEAQGVDEDNSDTQDQNESRKKIAKKSKISLSNTEKKQTRCIKATKRSKDSLSATSQKITPAKKVRRSSVAVDQQDSESDFENEEEMTAYTPVCHTLLDMNTTDSALKSGISFRRFSHVPSSLKIKRSRQLMYNTPEAVEEDIVSSPTLVANSFHCQGTSPLLQNSRPVQLMDSTPISSCLTSRHKGDKAKRKERRVTISDNVAHHNISPEVPFVERSGDMSTVLPSMSTTPVHYHQLSTPTSSPQFVQAENKIVHPDDKTTGLRRSHRTRVKPIEWYKNERIVYDRRDSGPVVVGIEPSREHIYVEQEKLKRRKRRQKLLAQKKRQSTRGRLAKRLSAHVPVPKNLDITVSTDIPVIQPDTQEEVLMGCFNPAAKASAIGPSGQSPSPGDPFTLKLITEQGLFTTGVLTLAPASEKPLQRTMSTAVAYVITYGKILVTINRATTVLQTGDHFFVPRGTVYRLKNLREEEASLSFTNLMMDKAEVSIAGQPT